MIRIRGPVEIGRMAAVAIGGRSLEFAADVARGAFQGGMRSGERETCKFQVVELSVVPGIESVTSLACAREIQRLVIRVRRLLKFGNVAGHAIR